MSKFVEGHIKEQEANLNAVRDLITDKGETTPKVQEVIDKALDKLEGWYGMRDMFK
ncbi:hypothetical protein [Spirosoma areae]